MVSKIGWTPGKRLNSENIQMILNVLNYMTERHAPDKSAYRPIVETAKATGVCYGTVSKIRTGILKAPCELKRKKRRKVICGYDVQQRIRQIINECFEDKLPTTNTIFEIIKKDPEIPKFSITTLRTVLKIMNFTYKRHGNQVIVVEKSESRAS